MSNKNKEALTQLNVDAHVMPELLKSIRFMINMKKKEWKAGEDWVRYAGPYFTSAEYEAAVKSLLEGWLVLGQDAVKFENKFPQYFGKKYGTLTNSGSSANLLMMLALTSKKSPIYRDPKTTKVILPVAGFPTTANPAIQLGYEPIWIDIELDTLNMDLNELEKVASKNPGSVLMFAHVLGNPPDMDRVMDIVKEYDLLLLEDCCDALNSLYDGKPLGSFGELASCSFYPAHHITMGEGGFVASNSREVERVIRSFREWGRDCYCVGEKANLLKNGTCGCRFSDWLPSMPQQIFDHKYVYGEIGYNLKPIELQASIGLVQLEKLKEITDKRKHNFNRLYDIFKNHSNGELMLPYKLPKSDPNWFAFPLTVIDRAHFSRAEFCGYLEDNKIQTRPYFAGNLLLHPGYTHLVKGADTLYPIATKATTDTFFLGTSPVITDEQLDYVESVVEIFFKRMKGRR